MVESILLNIGEHDNNLVSLLIKGKHGALADKLQEQLPMLRDLAEFMNPFMILTKASETTSKPTLHMVCHWLASILDHVDYKKAHGVEKSSPDSPPFKSLKTKVSYSRVN